MTPPVPDRRHGLLLAAAVAAVTVAVFLPSLRGDFLNWDDDANFLNNSRYRGLGTEQLTWMFTDSFGHYMPLTWLTLGLDYVVWGMNPLGYHLTSVLLHAANAVLCFALLLGLLRRAGPRGDPRALPWAAAAGALFFSIHPLRVESVAWITERRDVTSGLFFLLTLLAYVRMTDQPAGMRAYRTWLALSLAAFSGSLLCKAMGMTLPLVLVLLDAWPLRRFGPGRTAAVLREKLPYLALMVAGVVLTNVAQRHASAIYTAAEYPISQSLAQPGFRVAFYVFKTLLPIGLSPLYFYRPELGWPQAAGWVAIAGVTVLVLRRRREAPAAAAAWIAYGFLIAPVCGLVQAGPHYAADRYSYLACLPFAALAAAVLASIPLRAAAGIAAVVLAGLAALTVRQERIWNNSVTLWDAAIRLDPDVYYTWHNRGRAKAEGRDWEGAVADFTRAIELRSGFPDPWRERGRIRARQNRHDLAVQDLAIALSLEPGRADTALELGISEAHLGRPAEAQVHFSRALELRPDFAPAYVHRAQAELRLGRAAEARRDLDRALELRPDHAGSWADRALIRSRAGDLDGALSDLDRALSLAQEPPFYLRRATVRGMKGQWEAAVLDLDAALRLKPDFAEAYTRRGMVRLEQNRNPEAIADFEKALELTPAPSPQRAPLEAALRRAKGIK